LYYSDRNLLTPPKNFRETIVATSFASRSPEH
jgi:hypothetical protein